MNLPKAIKINKSILDGTYDHRDETMERALKLGIEALQRIKRGRELLPHITHLPLPGEDID